MTGSNGSHRRIARTVTGALASTMVAAGLVFGPAATAHADVLDDLAEQYVVGSGGGQLSNLLKVSLKLRAMGFKPSKANLAEITEAMDYRPNQNPLIEALKDTIAYQQKIKAQMEILRQYQQSQNGANSAVMGAGQMPADSNPAQIAGAPQPGAVPPGAVAPGAVPPGVPPMPSP